MREQNRFLVRVTTFLGSFLASPSWSLSSSQNDCLFSKFAAWEKKKAVSTWVSPCFYHHLMSSFQDRVWGKVGVCVKKESRQLTGVRVEAAVGDHPRTAVRTPRPCAGLQAARGHRQSSVLWDAFKLLLYKQGFMEGSCAVNVHEGIKTCRLVLCKHLRVNKLMAKTQVDCGMVNTKSVLILDF